MTNRNWGPSPVVKTSKSFQNDDGVPFSFAGQTTVAIEQGVISGGSVPDYKKKIAAQQDASSAYIRNSTELDVCEPFMVRGDRTRTPLFGSLHEILNAEIYIGAIINDAMGQSLANLITEAQRKFVAKANATQRSLAGGVVLGELGETLRGILHPARALREALPKYLERVEKRARKARMRHGRRISVAVASVRESVQGAVSGTWLEWSFGAQPLVNDVEGGAKALAALNVNGGSHVQRIATQSETNEVTSSDGSYGFSGWGQFDYVRTQSTDLSVSYYGGVTIPMPQTNVSRLLGVTLADMPVTMWELVPFSFLADYFVNVGSILDSLSVLQTKFVFLGTTQKRRVEVSVQKRGWKDNVYPPGKFVTPPDVKVTGGQTVTHRLTFTRSPIPVTALIPSLTVSIPGMNMKWVNMAALAAQATNATKRIVIEE